MARIDKTQSAIAVTRAPANADFAERFLRDEGIPVVGGSLRGDGGRRVHYWPVSGRALQRGVTDTVAPRPVPIAPPVETGALELF